MPLVFWNTEQLVIRSIIFQKSHLVAFPAQWLLKLVLLTQFHTPQPILLKRYPWIRDIKPAIKDDLIDLIHSFCVVPDDAEQQSLG
jgi:hypothetical protein